MAHATSPVLRRIGRRIFLETALIIPASINLLPGADSDLFVLKQDDIERLRVDFNSNRDKVRLIFMLSPT